MAAIHICRSSRLTTVPAAAWKRPKVFSVCRTIAIVFWYSIATKMGRKHGRVFGEYAQNAGDKIMFCSKFGINKKNY